MDTREQELIKVIEEASKGNWYPALIVGGLFTLLFVLSGYVIKLVLKANEDKHNDTYKLLSELTKSHGEIAESQKKTDIVIAQLKIMVEYHEKRLEK